MPHVVVVVVVAIAVQAIPTFHVTGIFDSSVTRFLRANA